MYNSLLYLGFGFLFFLPVIESFDRFLAMMFLLAGSTVISLTIAWKHSITFDKRDYLFICFLAVALISTLQSISIPDSFGELMRYGAYFILFVSINNIPDKDFLFKKFLVPMLLVNSLLLTALYALSANPWVPILDKPQTGMNLFYPTWGYNRIAIYLLFTLPILWGASSDVSGRRRIIARIISLFFLLVIFQTLARGVLLSLAFALGFTAFIKKEIVFSWQRLSVLINTVVVVILIGSFSYSNILYPDKYQSWKIQGWYKPAQVEERFAYIEQAIRIFLAHPLFGTGLETFRYASGSVPSRLQGSSWYAHNHFLELFAETGVFGGSLFFIFITVITVMSFINIIPHENMHGLLIALTTSIFHSLLDYDWHYISIFLIVFLGFALIDRKFKSGILKV